MKEKTSVLIVQPAIIVQMVFLTILKSVTLAIIAFLVLLVLLKMAFNVQKAITALQEQSFRQLALKENIRFLELNLKTTVEIALLGSTAFSTLNHLQ